MAKPPRRPASFPRGGLYETAKTRALADALTCGKDCPEIGVRQGRVSQYRQCLPQLPRSLKLSEIPSIVQDFRYGVRGRFEELRG